MRARDFVVERKRKKKKSLKAAAWGPGPYGMYGWDTGYSGVSEQLDKPTPSLEDIAKKHQVNLDYLKKQLQVGIQIEFEHTNNRSTAKEIALDHLSEKPDYYEKLKRVEENIQLDELNVAQTLNFIKKAHGNQLYGKLPYWTHPRAVALTGRKIFGSKFNSNAVKTAFLHDVVEDTHIGLDELSKLDFDKEVIEAVGLLTKDKTLSYEENIKKIISSGNPLAMMVKYADNYENFTGDKSSWDPNRAAASQKKYLASLNMLGDVLGVKHHIGEELTVEGWKDWVAGAALGAAALGANAETVKVMPGQTVYSIAKAMGTTPQAIQKANKLDKNFTVKTGQELKIPGVKWNDTSIEKEKKPEIKKSDKKEIKISKADLEDSITGRPLEVYFRKFLESQGIQGEELAAIMAQSDVETDHFKTLKEYGGKNYFKMYEPVYRKDKKTGKVIIDPETKKPKHFNDKADGLGNDYRGDGSRYKGRGFLQITGRYNYRVIGQDIGVDLENNPEILEKDKAIAAKASLAYWKRFSKPKIKDFKNVKGVTSTINPGLKHLQKRQDRHQEYKVAMR